MAAKLSFGFAFVVLLHVKLIQAESASCLTATVSNYLTSDSSTCYVDQTIDYCTPFNENDANKVREIINCTDFDTTYKVLALAPLISDALESTLPEDERNQSMSMAETIVSLCSAGYPLPTPDFSKTCDEYLALVTVTCEEPVTLSIPDVSNVGECTEEVTEVCNTGDKITWKNIKEQIGILRCVYFRLWPVLPPPEY
ncbi:uncharacterized protein LOC144142102 isoform X2 [Haemaphysalis longicornis]